MSEATTSSMYWDGEFVAEIDRLDLARPLALMEITSWPSQLLGRLRALPFALFSIGLVGAVRTHFKAVRFPDDAWTAAEEFSVTYKDFQTSLTWSAKVAGVEVGRSAQARTERWLPEEVVHRWRALQKLSAEFRARVGVQRTEASEVNETRQPPEVRLVLQQASLLGPLACAVVVLNNGTEEQTNAAAATTAAMLEGLDNQISLHLAILPDFPQDDTFAWPAPMDLKAVRKSWKARLEEIQAHQAVGQK